MEPSSADHTPDHEQLAALSALRLLQGDERRAFEAHLAACPRCEQIVGEDRHTLAELAAIGPEVDPSPGFKERLLERARRELHSGASPTSDGRPHEASPERQRILPFRRRQAWFLPLVASLLVILGLSAVAAQQSYARQVVASAVLNGVLQQGTATVVVRRSGAVELELRGLPDPPSGQVYEAWVAGASGSVAAAGTSPSGTGTISLTEPAAGKTVLVTLEPAPGTPSPTSPPILRATVPA